MNKTITTRFNSLIEKKVGLPIASIRRMCSDEITRHIEENKHVSLKLSSPNDGCLIEVICFFLWDRLFQI